MTARDWLLGVDGGGTKTHAVVADETGRVLGRGLGPGSNHHRVGLEAACQAITCAVEGALAAVTSGHRMGTERPALAAGCFGLAGVDGPDDQALLERWVAQQRFARRQRVLNDSELVLAAGTPDGHGVALISGTGSVCLGRAPDGRGVRVGGWGPVMGDEGSGYQIAVRALHATGQTLDGRAQARALMQAVLKHWSLDGAQGLIAKVYAPGITHAEIATLTTVVLELAGRGDADARAILAEAAGDLARQVATVVERLELRQPPLALAGGALRGHLRRELGQALAGLVGTIQYVTDPALGALALARRLVQAAPRA